jgi:predicted GIY-YIG superfamily endonuclease
MSLMYYFYIIYSATLDRYYTGYTLNLEERIRKHNTGHNGHTGKSLIFRRLPDLFCFFSHNRRKKRLTHQTEESSHVYKNYF